MTKEYKSQSARDAQAANFGIPPYWDYLDQQAQEKYQYYMDKGNPQQAQFMLTRSLSETLKGNNGD